MDSCGSNRANRRVIPAELSAQSLWHGGAKASVETYRAPRGFPARIQRCPATFQNGEPRRSGVEAVHALDPARSGSWRALPRAHGARPAQRSREVLFGARNRVECASARAVRACCVRKRSCSSCSECARGAHLRTTVRFRCATPWPSAPVARPPRAVSPLFSMRSSTIESRGPIGLPSRGAIGRKCRVRVPWLSRDACLRRRRDENRSGNDT